MIKLNKMVKKDNNNKKTSGMHTGTVFRLPFFDVLKELTPPNFF